MVPEYAKREGAPIPTKLVDPDEAPGPRGRPDGRRHRRHDAAAARPPGVRRGQVHHLGRGDHARSGLRPPERGHLPAPAPGAARRSASCPTRPTTPRTSCAPIARAKKPLEVALVHRPPPGDADGRRVQAGGHRRRAGGHGRAARRAARGGQGQDGRHRRSRRAPRSSSRASSTRTRRRSRTRARSASTRSTTRASGPCRGCSITADHDAQATRSTSTCSTPTTSTSSSARCRAWAPSSAASARRCRRSRRSTCR